MSNHCGYVVKVEHLRKHPNADRLQILTVFGISLGSKTTILASK